MNQVKQINQLEEKNLQSQGENRFETCEQVVENLVEQGLPNNFTHHNFLIRIAKVYGISLQEARTCLKLAVKQLEATSKTQEEEPQEERYAQSGYFYPSGYSQPNKTTSKKDGMDSLSSLGSYNRLMFGLR